MCIIYAFFSISFVKLSTSFSTFVIYILSTKNSSLLYFFRALWDNLNQPLKNILFSFLPVHLSFNSKAVVFSSNTKPCVGSFRIIAHSYRLFVFKYWRYMLVSSRFIDFHVLIPVFSLAFHWSNPTSNIFFKHQHISMFVSNSNIHLSGHSSHSLHVTWRSQYSEAGFSKVCHANSGTA